MVFTSREFWCIRVSQYWLQVHCPSLNCPSQVTPPYLPHLAIIRKPAMCTCMLVCFFAFVGCRDMQKEAKRIGKSYKKSSYYGWVSLATIWISYSLLPCSDLSFITQDLCHSPPRYHNTLMILNYSNPKFKKPLLAKPTLIMQLWHYSIRFSYVYGLVPKHRAEKVCPLPFSNLAS